MKIYTGIQHDSWHHLNKPGSYEWQYFDADSDCGLWSVTIIMFDGIPMSPYYLDSYLDGNQPLPEKYRGYVVSVYHKHTRVFYTFHQFEKANVHFSDDNRSISIGDSTVSYTQDDGWNVAIDTRHRSANSSIHCELLFSPMYNIDEKSSMLDFSENHVWMAVAPICKVRGTISILESLKPIADIQFVGNGYHDHNAGVQPLHEDFGAWYWGRCFLHEATSIIFYQTSDLNKKQHIESLFIATKDGLRQIPITSFEEEGKFINLFCLPIAKSLRWVAKDETQSIQLTICPNAVLERSPFYYRVIADVTYVSDSTTVQTTCLMEYYHPQRLLNPIVRAMVRTPFVIFPDTIQNV